MQKATHVAPWLSHKTWHHTVLHPDALRGVFEEDGIVCHADGIPVSECGFEDAGSSLGICQTFDNERQRGGKAANDGFRFGYRMQHPRQKGR